jgi:hypothetical protein
MGSALGEVPNVAIIEYFFLIPPKFINSRDENGTIVYNAPFSL